MNVTRKLKLIFSLMQGGEEVERKDACEIASMADSMYG